MSVIAGAADCARISFCYTTIAWVSPEAADAADCARHLVLLHYSPSSVMQRGQHSCGLRPASRFATLADGPWHRSPGTAADCARISFCYTEAPEGCPGSPCCGLRPHLVLLHSNTCGNCATKRCGLRPHLVLLHSTVVSAPVVQCCGLRPASRFATLREPMLALPHPAADCARISFCYTALVETRLRFWLRIAPGISFCYTSRRRGDGSSRRGLRIAPASRFATLAGAAAAAAGGLGLRPHLVLLHLPLTGGTLAVGCGLRPHLVLLHYTGPYGTAQWGCGLRPHLVLLHSGTLTFTAGSGAADCARISFCYTRAVDDLPHNWAADCARISFCYTAWCCCRIAGSAADCARISFCYTSPA